MRVAIDSIVASLGLAMSLLSLGMPLRTAALLLAAGSASATAFAQETDKLRSLINAYREAPRQCGGQTLPAAGPLAADPALSRAQLASAGDIQEALARLGYKAASAQTISLSGPDSAESVMRFIEQNYCRQILDPQFSEIGISREGNTWSVVLAQPRLPADLKDWRAEGKEILRLTNKARSKARTCGGQQYEAAPPLTWDQKLGKAALAHSQSMAEQVYFSHEGKDGSTAGQRAQQAGYAWQRIGENIASGQGTPQKVVSGWLSSPGHCANIMNPRFTEMGAAYALNPDSDLAIYWTQVFGTPQ